jgi:GH15 family glucan-1,4-alpha-glucosidase
MERTSRHLGTLVIPAGPHRRVDPGIIGSLVACHPLGLIPPHDPAMAATVEAVRERFLIGSAFFHGISHTGLGTYLTLQLAFVELAAGDWRALDRLEWLVGAASSTFTWPEAIHPLLGDGCMGDGHHGWATADFLSFVRELLVRLQAHPGAGSVRLTAPGLDPSWSSVEPRGEVELAIGALARSGGWPR